jgi:hypothetical protein
MILTLSETDEQGPHTVIDTRQVAFAYLAKVRPNNVFSRAAGSVQSIWEVETASPNHAAGLVKKIADAKTNDELSDRWGKAVPK